MLDGGAQRVLGIFFTAVGAPSSADQIPVESRWVVASAVANAIPILLHQPYKLATAWLLEAAPFFVILVPSSHSSASPDPCATKNFGCQRHDKCQPASKPL